MYFGRTMEAFLPTASRQAPVLLIVGARQVGKSTLLRQAAAADRQIVTLDDPLLLQLAQADPAMFLQRFPPPVLIDEIQYAPQLLPHIKMLADSLQKPGLFWLSGSQPFHLMRNVSESLAGRVTILNLLGLSLRERLGQGKTAKPFLFSANEQPWLDEPLVELTAPLLYEMIWRGSYPAMSADETLDRDLFYASYMQTYLQRDVRDLARVGDEAAFVRFVRATAARTAQLLNLADLARDADIAPNTAKHWLSILQASGIVMLLEPWHSNSTSRLVKAPKLHFVDSGLCAWLTAWSSPQTLEAGAFAGPILESWVFGEIVKSWWHNGKSAQFYHLRDKDQREVDLLLVRDGVAHPIEVKKTAAPSARDIRHFPALSNGGLTVGLGAVICLCTQAVPLSSHAWALPVGVI